MTSTDQANVQVEILDLRQGAQHRRIDPGVIVSKYAATDTRQQNNAGGTASGIGLGNRDGGEMDARPYRSKPVISSAV